jgi:quercetin dioxygenase-like cupin family protein
MQNPFPDRIQSLPLFEGQFPANMLKAENCDIYFSTLKKGTVIPDHEHETANYSIVTSGEFILELDGKERKYSTGEWCYVPAKVTHAARTEVDASLIEFWFKS